MNILELKRTVAGNVFRISEGEENGWYDNAQSLPSSLINSTTPKLTEAEKPKQVQIQVGQTEAGEPIWETQDAASQPAKLGLKDAYAAGQEQDYVKDMQDTLASGTGTNNGLSPEAGGDWQSYAPQKAETFTPEEAVDLYNKMDPRLANDPNMAGRLASANKYYKDGSFIPGSELASADNFKSYLKQSDLDDAKQSRNMRLASLAGLAVITGGAVLAGGAAVGGGAAAAGGAGGGLTSAQIAAASAEAVASGGAAGTAAGSGWAGANSLLATPVGKFVASQGVGLGMKALTGAGQGQKQNPGLMNSSQNKPQPIVNNYYSGQQQRPAPTPAPAPKPIASANGSMYGSGSGWSNSINKYVQKKPASGG